MHPPYVGTEHSVRMSSQIALLCGLRLMVQWVDGRIVIPKG